jgi:hypothetical protein
VAKIIHDTYNTSFDNSLVNTTNYSVACSLNLEAKKTIKVFERHKTKNYLKLFTFAFLICISDS